MTKEIFHENTIYNDLINMALDENIDKSISYITETLKISDFYLLTLLDNLERFKVNGNILTALENLKYSVVKEYHDNILKPLQAIEFIEENGPIPNTKATIFIATSKLKLMEKLMKTTLSDNSNNSVINDNRIAVKIDNLSLDQLKTIAAIPLK